MPYGAEDCASMTPAVQHIAGSWHLLFASADLSGSAIVTHSALQRGEHKRRGRPCAKGGRDSAYPNDALFSVISDAIYPFIFDAKDPVI